MTLKQITDEWYTRITELDQFLRKEWDTLPENLRSQVAMEVQIKINEYNKKYHNLGIVNNKHKPLN
jgi:predicted Zn-dependent protease with MMP-like domain